MIILEEVMGVYDTKDPRTNEIFLMIADLVNTNTKVFSKEINQLKSDMLDARRAVGDLIRCIDEIRATIEHNELIPLPRSET